MVATLAAEIALPIRAELGEGPLWDHRAGVLRFVDYASRRLHAFDPARGTSTSRWLTARVAAVAPYGSDGFVATTPTGFGLVDRDVRVVAPLGIDGETVWMNDGKCDSRGRFWAGTATRRPTPDGGLYRLDREHRATRVLSGVAFSNGLGWSPDGRRFYHVDTTLGRVTAYDFDADDGLPANPQPIVVLPESEGLPDGLAVDADGCLWLALWGAGQVRRYAPDGRLDATVAIPTPQVTSCAFGGAGLCDLYVTTAAEGRSDELAGALFRVETGTCGLPTQEFAA